MLEIKYSETSAECRHFTLLRRAANYPTYLSPVSCLPHPARHKHVGEDRDQSSSTSSPSAARETIRSTGGLIRKSTWRASPRWAISRVARRWCFQRQKTGSVHRTARDYGGICKQVASSPQHHCGMRVCCRTYHILVFSTGPGTSSPLPPYPNCPIFLNTDKPREWSARARKKILDPN